MPRTRPGWRAEWFVMFLVLGASACAVASSENPEGFPDAAGSGGSATGGGATDGGGNGGGSPGGTANHGGFNYGGAGAAGSAAGSSAAMGGSSSAGSGGSLGVSGSAGTNASGSAGSNGGSASSGGTNGGSGAGSGGTSSSGSSSGGSNSSGSSSGGSAGSGPTVVYARDYQFDSNTSPFSLSQYGSTPNVGLAGGPEKLSAQSTLSQTSMFGSPQKGSARIVIPFSQYAEQLDMNSGFDGARENWTGYRANARIKIVSGGNGDSSCPIQAWIYITSGGDYAFGRGTAVDLTGTWQDMTYDFATPAEGLPDLTQVNQLGVQVYSNDCAGSPSFSTTTVVIDNLQVHKP